MKKFIVKLFSNRFGIILATLNLCYFVSKGNALFYHPSGKYFLCANLPAVISTGLSVEFIRIFLPNISPAAEMTLGNTLFVVFIVFQWLFIAWLARTIAQKLRQTNS